MPETEGSVPGCLQLEEVSSGLRSGKDMFAYPCTRERETPAMGSEILTLTLTLGLSKGKTATVLIGFAFYTTTLLIFLPGKLDFLGSQKLLN